MKAMKNLLFLGAVCMTLSGCGKTDQKKYDWLIKNMSSAKTLFIGSKAGNPSKSRASQNESTKTLFMLTDEGYVEEVTYAFIDCKSGICKPKKEKQINAPNCVFDVNDQFLMICFSNYPTQYEPYQDYNYLVNKETGRCYKMPYTFVPYYAFTDIYLHADGIPTREMFMTCSDGSIYFKSQGYYDPDDPHSSDTGLKKLDVSNPDNITAENISLKNDNLDQSSMPALSASGAIAYNAHNNNSQVSRYIKKDGSFLNLDVLTNGFATDFWTGYDGYIYCGKDIKMVQELFVK